MAELHSNITDAANGRARFHAASRRFDYQINIPRRPQFQRIIKQAIKIMDSVEDCEHLEVCDNGVVICSLYRGDVGKGDNKTKGIRIECSLAAHGREVKDINHACMESKNLTTNLEFSHQFA